MINIPQSENTFKVIPEGKHVFKILEIDYKQALGHMIVKMVTKDGQKHQETFRFKNAMGDKNEGAIKAFSFFARTALNDLNYWGELDEQELVGHYIQLTVKHNVVPSTNDPSKNLTFVNVGDYNVAEGFEPDSDIDPLDEL